MPSRRLVQLNVGGVRYTTTVDTLRKHPNSKLAEMLSHQTSASLDAQGCIFIDRPGAHFGPILDYLRCGQLPSQNLSAVYKEAQFYQLEPLVKWLEETPELFGEQVARKQFVLRVPGYGENLELLVRLARAEAVAARHSRVLVCAMQSDGDAARCADSLRQLEDRGSVVKFGPWKASPSIRDLLDCVLKDLQSQGYRVTYQASPEAVSRGKVGDHFYTFLFTWW